MTIDELLDAYGRLIVDVGVGVEPGDTLLVDGDIENAGAARAVARAAYVAGAARVDVRYADQRLRRIAVDHAPLEELAWTPPWLVQRLEGATTLVSLRGQPDLELMDGADERRAAEPINPGVLAAFFRAVEANSLAWTAVPAPTEGWARAVFGEPDVERLWAAVAYTLRLDEEDPAAAWRAHADLLQRRAADLTARGFDRVHFRGPGTDLSIGLHPGNRWYCGVTETGCGPRLHREHAHRGGADDAGLAARGRHRCRDPAARGAGRRRPRSPNDLRRRSRSRRRGRVRPRADRAPPRDRRGRAAASARSRSSPATRGSARPASSSSRPCSTRTPPATSPTAARRRPSRERKDGTRA